MWSGFCVRKATHSSEVRAVEPERQTYRDQRQLKLRGGGVTAAALSPNLWVHGPIRFAQTKSELLHVTLSISLCNV